MFKFLHITLHYKKKKKNFKFIFFFFILNHLKFKICRIII